ncbi:MAG: GAF domain-containing protein, partial [Verrucomicrobia bacterium]|nr:GAF domain-containing protein [Verrucomicrobiota bacterium]
YLKRGFDKIAQVYLRDARSCYLRWGALGKVRQLDQGYPHWLEPVSAQIPSSLSAQVNQLDLVTVVKASQAVSGEIVLGKLIETLMVIAVEHAGAERGLLILPRKDDYQIEAEAVTVHDKVEVDLTPGPATSLKLPMSILNYVIRTRQSVILDDALLPNFFSDDTNMLWRRPRSVLCVPLVKQTELMGVLYLENSLIARAFTPDRLVVLELLASQAAISLDNARLYTDLAQEASVRKKAEEALRASEERWRRLFEHSSVGITLKNSDQRLVETNPAFQSMLGYTQEELKTLTPVDITYEDDRAVTELILADLKESRRQAHQVEKRFRRKDGSVLWADVSAFFVPATESTPAFFPAIVVDITERKRAEAKLARLNRTLQTLNECNHALVHATAEDELLQSLCRILVEVGGLRMAWVGYRELDEQKTVRPIAQAGYEAGYLERVNITWADTERGRGPAGTAIRTGKPFWTSDNLTDPSMAPWRVDALKRGYASSISLPLLSRGEAFGALTLHAGEPDAFNESTIEQYTDFANNLAYGVTAIRTREESKRAESEIRQLNASLEKRVAERTFELVQSNDQLKRAEEKLRKRSEQVQKHHDVLLGLAHADKSDLVEALQTICSVSAATLEVARVSYWLLQENVSAIACEILYLLQTGSFDEEFKGTRLGFSECPAYFAALTAKRPIVADSVLEHPATSGLAENYLKQHGISSLLATPVWLSGEIVGVLCHEHIGTARHWSPEEIDFVSTLAATISLALEESNRARSEHLLRESEARLRESEQRFGAAFRAGVALIGILRLSDEKFIEVNDALVEWYGSDRDAILGHTSLELGLWVNVEERKRYFDGLRRHGTQRDFECQFRKRRGTIHMVHLSADIVEINREPCVLAFGMDITQRKQAETELRRTLAREKELGQLRSNFVSMVSHEFRTPLGIIQSSAEILDDYLDQLDPAERQLHLQSIYKNTRRMSLLMEEVLLIGSLDAGKMEFKPAPLDLPAFVRKLVDEVLSASSRRCPIKLSISEIPVEIQADERLLRHIFTNLLTNAVKYSDAGDPVRFEIRCAEAEIVFTIRDQGIGIPEADREWLFNAFHRGHNVNDRPGTGLGLVIVKRCVDLHGGQIKVESEVGQGTVMTVSLPISDGPSG